MMHVEVHIVGDGAAVVKIVDTSRTPAESWSLSVVRGLPQNKHPDVTVTHRSGQGEPSERRLRFQ